MSSYNRVILIGRLACDVEQKATASGTVFARFRLAVDRRVRKGSDSANNADFIPIIAWDRLAEICGQYLTKGKLVAIEGRLQTRTYEVDGTKRSAFDVVADDMRMLSTRDSGSRPNNGGGYGNEFSDAAPQDAFGDDGGDDMSNIPF